VVFESYLDITALEMSTYGMLRNHPPLSTEDCGVGEVDPLRRLYRSRECGALPQTTSLAVTGTPAAPGLALYVRHGVATP
jgi:hypothetical protein